MMASEGRIGRRVVFSKPTSLWKDGLTVVPKQAVASTLEKAGMLVAYPG